MFRVYLGSQSAWPCGPEKLIPLGSGTQTLLFCPVLSWTKMNKEEEGATKPRSQQFHSRALQKTSRACEEVISKSSVYEQQEALTECPLFVCHS